MLPLLLALIAPVAHAKTTYVVRSCQDVRDGLAKGISERLLVDGVAHADVVFDPDCVRALQDAGAPQALLDAVLARAVYVPESPTVDLAAGVSFVVADIGRDDAYHSSRAELLDQRCWVGEKGLTAQPGGWHSGTAACADGEERFFYRVKVAAVEDCVEPMGGVGGPGAIWVPCGTAEGDGDVDPMAEDAAPAPAAERSPRLVVHAPAAPKPAARTPTRDVPAPRATSRAPQSWPDLAALVAGAGAAAGRDGVNDAAVVVAIEDYLDVEDVAGARANADAWVRWLGQVRGVPAARILKAYDREAKDIRIRELAQRAAREVKPGGTLWFVFIGHGAPSTDGKDGLLVGVDADRTASGIYARSVPRAELLALLGAGAQAQTVALLDACFSGQSGSGGTLVAGLQPLLPLALSGNADTRARVLAAAGPGEFSGPLAGAKRPAFSYLALGGLLGWADLDQTGNHDGRVAAQELRDYVAGALNITVQGRSQTPVLMGADAELAKVAAASSPDLYAMPTGP